jgi:hypothetical protein
MRAADPPEILLDIMPLFVVKYYHMDLCVPDRNSMLNIWWWDS